MSLLSVAASSGFDPSALLLQHQPATSAAPAACASVAARTGTEDLLLCTLVLPDGFGDLTFGELAVRALTPVARSITWVRVYANPERRSRGEKMVQPTVTTLVSNSHVFESTADFATHLGNKGCKMSKSWKKAGHRLLCPWIFSTFQDDVWIRFMRDAGLPFWVLSEYGRGVGNIKSYSGGHGAFIPSGWPSSAGTSYGVFRDVLQAAPAARDWKAHFANLVGVPRDRVRLWWFYSRRDQAPSVSFADVRSSGEVDGVARYTTVKRIPVDRTGNLAVGHVLTSGEILANQLQRAANTPGYDPGQLRLAEDEVERGKASKLSQFLWDVIGLKGEAASANNDMVEVVIAPNVLTDHEAGLYRVEQMELVEVQVGQQRGAGMQSEPERPLYISTAFVPRDELAALLGAVEKQVFVTGDHSLSEAVFSGLQPVASIRPDAKIQQWEQVLKTQKAGRLDDVVDLGYILRKLVSDRVFAEAARELSDLHSAELEARLREQYGPSPSAQQEALIRAGVTG